MNIPSAASAALHGKRQGECETNTSSSRKVRRVDDRSYRRTYRAATADLEDAGNIAVDRGVRQRDATLARPETETRTKGLIVQIGRKVEPVRHGHVKGSEVAAKREGCGEM